MEKRLLSRCVLSMAVAAMFGAGSVARAAFTAGNLAVDRVGDGTQTLANTGNSQFIDEYTPTGALANSYAVASSGPGSLIVSGTATSEGFVSLSADSSQLTVSGYNTAQPFSASVTSSTSTNVSRGFGSLDSTGAYTFGGTYGAAFSANNIRSSVLNGTVAYAAGANSGTVTSTGTTIQSTVANTRVVNIIGGNLDFSTGSGTKGVYGFTGIPTAASTPTLLIADNNSPYDFAINGTTAYVADDTASAVGGILKYSLIGGVWTFDYTLGTGVANIGARGLAVDFSGTNPLIYATTAEGTANRLISITDTGATSAATTLATAASGEIFRGLDFAPTAPTNAPEPASLGVLAIGGMALLSRRRK